ncbi:adenylate/guanylate cyclase domain-containing protein [Nocardia puris]|uniref:Adenylate cyclase n=1 Tax=Nocardia puris TaxID=208602 RepID=A0A366DA10_9NOCA|nr:adenylate/guanylate cyclase domain-containing protein [Nocardia puris]MBF6211672.1 adenylate/guanylate cyclase domain-containing protein [Nocardia puris]MBF6365676.1 adenylate/guanylate cyclase domain-containing protein [Nocardia puris]MBF6460682.1 adenylate/guanylate cyclase domain-containing protein [Nocardia puris]RBO86846.1 adenylate cyclase [Nocardia puris]
MATSEVSRLVQSAVEECLLGGERKYTRVEVAKRSGVSPEVSRRLWTALGFPASSDPEVDYTDADVAAVRDFRGLKVAEKSDLRQQAATARTIGQAMARLAEWQADLVLAEIGAQIAAAEAEGRDPAEVAKAAAERTISVVQELQSYVWRRHLSAALSRSFDGGATAEDSTRTLAVGFADMVGYTRLTRHLHPDELSTLLEAFESTTTAAIAENGGWVIKHVGDEVMFAAETAVDGARIAIAIQESTMMVGGTPELRVALAYGEVLQRFGDLYGSVVNIASRLTGVARPGTILIDDAAAEELADHPEFEVRNLRSVRVRGFNRLRPHTLRAN